MTGQEKLLERIQKLMALADPERNDSQSQVEAASAKVAELLARHGLTVEDVAGFVVKSERTISSERHFFRRKEHKGTLLLKVFDEWLVDLAEAIAFACYCKALHTYSGATFIGKGEDPKIAVFIFSSLGYRLLVLSKEAQNEYSAAYKAKHGVSPWQYAWGRAHPRPWRRAWLEGAVSQLTRRLREARWEKEFSKRASKETRALVVQHQKDIEAYFEDQFPKVAAKEGIGEDDIHGSQGSRGAWSAGYDKARDIPLQSGLKGSGDQAATAALPEG